MLELKLKLIRANTKLKHQLKIKHKHKGNNFGIEGEGELLVLSPSSLPSAAPVFAKISRWPEEPLPVCSLLPLPHLFENL